MLDPRSYYRLPWSLTDNGISWLEPTTKCNLACEGCYRDNVADSDKTLDQVAADLEVFRENRISDCMSIAGGDPLVHPQIVDIVRMVKKGGWKPIINTNGLALTPSLLHDLKKAGAFGFTFHVDSSQHRADSEATTEAGHNALRQKFAEMVAREGGLCCAFNQTVTSDTLDQVPDVVRWAAKHPGIVHAIVFILFRAPRLSGDFDFYAGEQHVRLEATYRKSKWGGAKNLMAEDIVSKIREADPSYEPSAYLNGTVNANSMKWLVAVRALNKKKVFGYVGPRFMEWVQLGSRMFRKRWLSYASPGFMATGRLASLLFSPVDPKMRTIFLRCLAAVFRNPLNLFRRVHLQSIGIIQPVDILADGRMDMCDGCPDMTVHNGKLYWSCRLEEVKEFGTFVTAGPKAEKD